MRDKAILTFAAQFGVNLAFDNVSLVENNWRIFAVSRTLEPLVTGNFFYAGTYMGKIKRGMFFPSFVLLAMIAKAGGNRVVVDAKAAWLFICGRDVFSRGIVQRYGSLRRNCHVLVVNVFGECLGFGRVVGGFGGEGGVAIKNVVDVGDFLRRERF